MLLVLLLLNICWYSHARDSYEEELNIVELASGNILGHFRFRTLRNDVTGSHFDKFPKIIGELLRHYKIEEFHLSLTQGLWKISQWGFPPVVGSPSGAQLWAWFAENVTNIDRRWPNFVHALSGLFCASLDQMEPVLTAVPEFTFRPEGLLWSSLNVSDEMPHPVRYATLPSENVCTENLTPWKKLLPCKLDTGIVVLLSPLRLYSEQFHSISIDVRKICAELNSQSFCSAYRWELVLSVTVVFDTADPGQKRDWSLASLFGSTIQRSCPLAISSTVNILTKEGTVLEPLPSTFLTKSDGVSYASFDVHEYFRNDSAAKSFNIMAHYPTPSAVGETVPPLVSIHSYIAGTGLQGGNIVSHLTNRSPVKNITVIYAHVIPWFLTVFFHTLSITCSMHSNSTTIKPLFTNIQPGKSRKRPNFFEVALELPSSSSCQLCVYFERTLLRWAEYPPDAHHGFYIPAASVSFNTHDADNHTMYLGGQGTILQSIAAKQTFADRYFTRIFGEVLLVNLPTPDFSMPYNVICLVCTVVALAFGPIHTLTTKSFVLVPAAIAPSGMVHKITTKLKTIFGRNHSNKEPQAVASHMPSGT